MARYQLNRSTWTNSRSQAVAYFVLLAIFSAVGAVFLLLFLTWLFS